MQSRKMLEDVNDSFWLMNEYVWTVVSVLGNFYWN